MSRDLHELRREFEDAVNMAPKELENWLQTEESRAVGQKDGGGESDGHASDRRIVTIKRTRKEDLSEADYEHMREVLGYIHRHLKQGGPTSDTRHSNWRHSLMNWGHDPLKKPA
jgi:hypothetical protein